MPAVGGDSNMTKGEFKLDIEGYKNKSTDNSIGQYHRDLAKWSKSVDRGYAWVILAALWLTFAATLGTYRIYGLVFAEVTKDGTQSREDASWPVSTILTVENIVGPLVSVLSYRMSYRSCMLIGGACIAFGNAVAYWSNSLLIDILLIGFVQGVGYAFIFMPFMSVINSYFLKYRNIALGFSLCGGTMSVFALTPLFHWILGNFHWRASYLAIGMLACINILMVPLLRPNPKPESPRKQLAIGNGAGGRAAGMSLRRVLSFQNSMRRQSTVMLRSKPRNQRHGSIISVNPFAASVGRERKISRAIIDSGTGQQQQQEQAGCVLGRKLADVSETRSMHDIGLEAAESDSDMKSIVLDVLKTPGFHAIWYLELLYYWIFGIYCLVLVDFGLDRGCTHQQATDLMMFQSVGELVGRLGLTLLVDMHFTSYQNMICITLSLLGVILCTIPYVNGFILIATLTVILNSLASLLYILLNGLLVDVLGEDKVTIGYGMASFIVGFLIAFRPQAVGFFRDYLGSYEWLMISLGIGCAVGILLCLLDKLATRFCMKKNDSHNNSIVARS